MTETAICIGPADVFDPSGVLQAVQVAVERQSPAHARSEAAGPVSFAIPAVAQKTAMTSSDQEEASRQWPDCRPESLKMGLGAHCRHCIHADSLQSIATPCCEAAVCHCMTVRL